LSFLEEGILNENKKNNAGVKPFDVVMMFKILISQRYFLCRTAGTGVEFSYQQNRIADIGLLPPDIT